jgi:hypothetical protein
VYDTDLASGDSLTRVVAGIERHRHRTARLLDGLGDLEQAAVSARVPAGAQSRIDVSALVANLARRLRQADLRLERLAAELDVKTPMTCPDLDREETSHAHALRPLP